MAVAKTYHLVTLGCPKNEVDSEHFERLLVGHLQPAADPESADAIIVNTCGFIEASQRESLEVIRTLAAKKRPGQRLIVAGCLTQIAGDRVRAEAPGVDHVFGVGQWVQVARLLEVDAEAVYDIPDTPARLRGPSAYLKVADGCDAPCTFCVIPRIKGRFRSLPLGALVREAQRLVEAGAREIVLVAQDTTAWGEDFGFAPGKGLPGLLRALSEAVGEDVWLRIMYAYPSRVTPELVQAMAELPNVVKYLDVPLQHGSPAVLRRMRRPHNLEKTFAMVRMLREAMPDIVLRTSLIVGFPGETDEEFAELEQFVRAIEFDHVGVFTYSRQPHTPAHDLPDQVPERVKVMRRERLMRIQRRIAARRARTFIGRELDLLVEGSGEDEDGRPVVAGRTYREAPEVDGLVIAYGRAEAGERVRVRIEAAGDYDLFGRLAEESAS
jgi:ribosomal protein S12 methylthiotransferase